MPDNTVTNTPAAQPPADNSGARATRSSGASRGNGGNRGVYRGGYRSRGEQSIISVNQADKDFKGKDETIGVLGLPIEKNLKFGLSYEDFQESLMQYAEANFNKGNDLKPLIKFLIDPIQRIGAAPALPVGAAANPELLQIWKERLSKYNKRIETIEDNQVKLYGIILGQCTESLKSEIKGEDEYEEKEMDSDALWLMETIKKISAGINTKKNEVQAYINKCRDVWNCIQLSNESLDAFQKRFRSTAQTADLAGGEMLFLPTLKTIGLIDMERVNSIVSEDADEQAILRAAKLAELETARYKKVKERVLAMLFMQNANRSRYGKK